MSKKVYDQLIKVCELKGSLLTLEEFNSTFPELKTDQGWFYWLSENKREVKVQYPMTSSWHREAQGRPRLSEFTATTYAYQFEVKCD